MLIIKNDVILLWEKFKIQNEINKIIMNNN